MNLFAVVIVAALVGEALVRRVADCLDLQRAKQDLPAELQEIEDEETRRKSAAYAKAYWVCDTVSTLVFLLALLLFWFLGGFNWLDQALRSGLDNPVLRGTVFVLLLLLAKQVLMLPFDLYETFRIEDRFGFNQTTLGTFILDKVKVLLLGVLLGGAAVALVLVFFEYAGDFAWLYAWAGIALLSILLQILAPVVILPLFNDFEPLPEGELRSRLEALLARARFPAQRLSVVDGSRRTSKANAFFTGFGSKRRIALFDTLVENQSPEEIEAVLAHEIGHCKKGHIRHRLILGIVHTGILLGLLSLLIGNPSLYEAFRMDQSSVYAGLVFFSLLYMPVEFVLGLLLNALSRKQELEADHFIKEMAIDPEALISALKQLSVKQLANLTPHPLSVAINDAHPPLKTRIDSLQQADGS